MRLIPLLLRAGGALLLSSAAVSAAPQIGSFGFDVAGMDRAIAPGDDFAEFTGGGWKRDTPIPADRSNYGMFIALRDLSQSRTRTILEAAAKIPGDKTGDLYASFLDERAAEAKGLDPIRPLLAAIKAADSRAAIAAAMGRLRRIGVTMPFTLHVDPDDKAPDRYIATMRQSGLGLPGRDYYLGGDAKLAATRADYATHLARLLELAGEQGGASRAAAVIAFETALARAHWTRIAERDVDATYNKWSPADFAAKAPGFDWTAFFGGAGIARQPAILVAQPSAFAGEAKAFAATPVAVLRDYALLRTLESYAPFLSKKLVDENFAFTGTILGGTPENEPRWKRGVTLASGLMGEAIGREYVARYFPPEAKAAADRLVRNLIAAFDARLANLAWMAPETRVKARAKLAAFTPKIGYPERWRDYAALRIDRADLVGNVLRGREFDFQYDLDKLGKPIDRGEWGMTPMTVNAYANPVMNEIVFPAAILQPPFFDPNADPAINYGGIGVVIGHEMSHHFDDQGRHYDLTGKLADWWTPTDIARFAALTGQLVRQYDAYEPLPGLHIQGGMTLGENIADLAGLSIAHDAYRLSLGGRRGPVIDGFTADQRFYLGYAQIWRIKYREPALRQQVLTNEHSPGDYRVAEVRNVDPWYDAFAVRPGQKLYLSPDQRVRIW